MMKVASFSHIDDITLFVEMLIDAWSFWNCFKAKEDTIDVLIDTLVNHFTLRSDLTTLTPNLETPRISYLEVPCLISK